MNAGAGKWWRTRACLLGAALIVLINVMVLGGAQWNRAGHPKGVLALSERELSGWKAQRFDRENSGLSLRLVWQVLPEAGERQSYAWARTPEWLDEAKMNSLGFSPTMWEDGERRRGREMSREVWLVLEIDGDAYREFLERARAAVVQAKAQQAGAPASDDARRKLESAQKQLIEAEQSASRLFVVDAGVDADRLHSVYTDRFRYALVKGLVGPVRGADSDKRAARGRVVTLSVVDIHVPHAFRAVFDNGRGPAADKTEGFGLSADLAFGRRYEPWFERIEAVTVQPQRPPAKRG